MKYFPFIIALIFSIVACESDTKETDFRNLKGTFSVEIITPAGQTDSHSFLPYPGNLGRFQGKENIEVLVISESSKIGANIQVRPIASLILKEKNTIRNIIIASPIDSAKQLSQVTNFQEFIVENAGEKQIIQDWFLYQKGLGSINLVGWKDEKYALELIKTKKL